jgi:hypothetical protein
VALAEELRVFARGRIAHFTAPTSVSIESDFRGCPAGRCRAGY